MRSIVLAISTALLAAFSGATNPEEAAPEPATIEVVSGDAQTGSVGKALSAPVVVQVKTLRPAAGYYVSWKVVSGGGTVEFERTKSGSGGITSNIWTLGPEPGVQTLRAESGGTATISATATGGTVGGASGS